MPSPRQATPSAAAAADRSKAADDAAERAERNARAEEVAMDKARAALGTSQRTEGVLENHCWNGLSVPVQLLLVMVVVVVLLLLLLLLLLLIVVGC